MTDLAKLVVKLEAQTAQYQKELERAKAQLGDLSAFSSKSWDKFKTGALVAGTAVVGTLTALTASAISTADGFNQMSERTGLSTESLSELAYAAGLSDVELSDLDKSMAKLSKNAVAAANGSKKQAEAFDTLGVSVKNADGSMRSTEEIMLDIAQRFSEVEDGAEKAALAQELFGKAGTKLIPFLNQGRDGIKALKEEAAALGLTITEETANAADEFGDNLDRLQGVAAGLGRMIAADLLPTFKDLTDQMVDNAKESLLFQRVAEGTATAVRILLDVAFAAATTFAKLGNAIGALAAAAVAVAQGEWDRAGEIIEEATADNLQLEKEYQDQRAIIWRTGGDEVLKEVEVTATKIKEKLKAMPKAKDIVQEVKVTGATKIDEDGDAQSRIDKELDEMTQTTEERALAHFNKMKAAIDDLFARGKISEKQYAEREAALLDELLPEFEVTVKKIEEKKVESIDRMNEYEKAAAQETQNIISDFLTGSMDKSAKEILKSFVDMLLKMQAEALAADIATKIFGDPEKSGGGGGWLEAAWGFVGSMFGGGAPSRDSGGRGRKGLAYMIGRRAQPEMFVPDSPGRFIPAQQMMQSPTVNVSPQIINVRDPSEVPTAIQSGKGEAAILNVIGRNPSTIRNLLQG